MVFSICGRVNVNSGKWLGKDLKKNCRYRKVMAIKVYYIDHLRSRIKELYAKVNFFLNEILKDGRFSPLYRDWDCA